MGEAGLTSLTAFIYFLHVKSPRVCARLCVCTDAYTERLHVYE